MVLERHAVATRPMIGKALRWTLLAGYVAVVYGAVVGGLGLLIWPQGQAAVALSFLAAAVSAAGVRPVLRQIDRLVDRAVLHRTVTPYRALVTVAARLPTAGSVQQVLPALARVIADGVGARQASVWLLVDGKLVHAAEWPAALTVPAAVADLDELRSAPGVDHAVPILDDGVPRGALAIGKSGPASVTREDHRLLTDAAASAGLLLRTVVRNAELHDRLRQAEKLELELRSSRERLIRARDVERRRLVGEITAVTTDSLEEIKVELDHLRGALGDPTGAPDRVLARLRPALDELIERFRAVVRGVYPGVLRDEGPRAALEELAGDLPRPVLFTGPVGARVDWEIESGIYYAAAAAIQLLGRSRSDHPLRVRLGHDEAQLTVRVEDTAPVRSSAASLRSALANDSDRLAALGGGLTVEESPQRLTLLGWLPARIAPEITAPRTPAAPPEPPSAADSPASVAAESGAAPRIPVPRGATHRREPSGDEAESLLDRVRSLVGAACERYVDGPAGERLLDIAGRLDEPLRVALVGRVKSGKSTLLNALVGDELAATDAAECTQLPTWYRYGPRCQLTLYPTGGAPRSLEFANSGAAGAVGLGDFAPEAVDRLVVDWPAEPLRTLTFIDSPGLDSPNSAVSARTRDLLAPCDGGIPIADAVVYLLRDLSEADVRQLADGVGAADHSNPVAALGVVSRIDELGGGGVDALDIARKLVDTHRDDPVVRGLCQTVVAVAGLLAASASSLRDNDIAALRRLAELDESVAARLLLSADDFAEADLPREPGKAVRRDLLTRFGVFGVRLAVAVIRAGQAGNRDELAQLFLRHSGLDGFRELLVSRLAARADVLKARSAVLAVETVLAGLPPDDPHREALRYEVEHLRAGAHELVEIQVLDRLRVGVPRLSTVDSEDVERLLGAHGPNPRSRLALDPAANEADVRVAAAAQLSRWQQLAENPVAPREIRDICLAAVRSCEGLLQAAGSAVTAE